MKLSNNDMINYAAVLVIVVSLASIGMQITGYAAVTDTAVVNVTVMTSAAINFTTDYINFGEGLVDGGQSGAHLHTNGTATVDGNWTSLGSGFTLENIGNVNLSLGLMADNDADGFIGGTNPQFRYLVSESAGNAGSCASASGTWTDFTTSNVSVCANFPIEDTRDEVDVDIHLYIPSDSNVGELTATVTATGQFT
jgi:hypothetical protein